MKNLNTMYASHDKHKIKANMIAFAENPDMHSHLDPYFARQEDYQKITKNLRQPITKADMVIRLVDHMGVTGTQTTATVKFNKLDKAEQTWAKGNTWFRNAVLSVTEMKNTPVLTETFWQTWQ